MKKQLPKCAREKCKKRVTQARYKFCSPGCSQENQSAASAAINAPQRGQSTETDALVHQLQQNLRHFKGAYQRAVEERSQDDRLIKLFQRTIQAMPAIPASRFKSPLKSAPAGSGHEVPVLLLGDQQIGEEISFKETFGINCYNFDIYQRRLEMLEDRVLDILTNHQRADFDELVVLSMGDNVSGVIHDELQKFGHQHIVDQVYLGAVSTALFLYRLQKFGRWKKIRVSCVSGNHGRLSHEKESKKYYKNFDYMFNSIVATLLRNVEQIEFSIPQCLFTLVDVAGSRILQSHGHELPPSSLGIPLYSINRGSASYQELLAIADEARFDYWVLGHYHRPMELDNAIVNGTIAGLSEFGIGRFKPIMPVQRLLGFHSKWGQSWSYPIKLDKAPEAQVYKFLSDMAPTDALDLFADQIRATDKAAA